MSDTATVEATETEAKPAKKVKALTPCLCRAYAVEYKNAEGETERLVTGCEAETTAKFGPGHDAKLKSLLIGAGAKGHDVVKTTDEGEVRLSAMDAANEYGFASTVEKGITKAAEKEAAKVEREAKRAAAKAEREAKAAQAKADREAKKAEKERQREEAKAAKEAETSGEDEATDADA